MEAGSLKTLSAWITRWPHLIIAAVGLITAVMVFFALQVGMTTDVKDFFPDNHEQVMTYKEIERTFGSAEFIMVALEMDAVFTPLGIESITKLTAALAAVPGVGNVRSLTTVEEVKGTEWGVEVGTLLDGMPVTEADYAELRRTVLSDPMYAGSIVSHDGTTALHVIEVARGGDPVRTALAVQDLVLAYEGSGELYLTGTPVLNAVLADSMQSDLKILLPLVLLLVALILFAFFRTGRGVVLPFLTVILSLIWTLGIMGMLDKQLSPLNAVMPIILVSLGNAYGIYLLVRFNEGIHAGATRIEAVQQGLASVGIAVLLAGSTTIAGFLANASSSITQMRDFGIFTAVGVFVALGISLTLVPAIWLLLPTIAPERQISQEGAKSGTLHRLLGLWARWVTNHSGRILSGTAVLVVIALLGVPSITTDSNFFNFFDAGSQPRLAYDLVSEKFSGSESLEIVIEGDIQDPMVLAAMRSFQDDLEATGLVGVPTSVVNILERTNMAMNEGNSDTRILPEERDLIAQYFLLLEMSSDGFLDRFLTLDYGKARIQALVADSSTEATTRLFSEVDRLFAKHFEPLQLGVTQTGIIALLDALAGLIIDGQVKSLLFALVAVFLIVRLLLGSWEGSILSTILVGVTILGNFGLMGWLGIPLDIVTVLISSIGVGVGIDYSIHIYARFQEELRLGASPMQAVQTTIQSTGQAILVNAVAVMAGFVILLTSSFPPFRYFGSLVTATMFLAAVGSLTLLPALILWKRRRTSS